MHSAIVFDVNETLLDLNVLLAEPFSIGLGTKILFNFLIPFAVSSTSAAMHRK